ncbi:MAG TPA: hypothetical protein VKI62_09675 [Bacteroidota bacterium]|nr:hypothetical protein [Bacteroidota bacterium]
MKQLWIVCVAILFAGNVFAQVPSVGLPISLDLGVLGGISVPMGTLSDNTNNGWNAGAKARISGLIPIDIVAFGIYNRLPDKVDTYSSTAWLIGAGLELPLPSLIVKPYLGIDGFLTTLSNTGPSATSLSREGVGIGGGVRASVPILGSVDVGIKYQILNQLGQNANEQTLSQVAVNVALMFGVL